MSLTSFLKVPTVKARFKQDWPLPTPNFDNRSKHKEMAAPPLSPRPQLIGTAFDYILRFHLRQMYPSSEASDWVAETTAGSLKGRLRTEAHSICQEARQRERRFLDGAALDEELLVSALLLAQLDFISHSGQLSASGQLPTNGQFAVEPEDIVDLRRLANVCDWSQWSATQLCRLNPVFDLASFLVGGADADFQLDNTLYELKTVRRAGLSSEHYHQLIGYSVLNFLNNGPLIDELAIYFSRFVATVRWPAPHWSEAKHEPFLLWFCRSAHEVFGTGFLLTDIQTGAAIQPKIAALGAEFETQMLSRTRTRFENTR